MISTHYIRRIGPISRISPISLIAAGVLAPLEADGSLTRRKAILFSLLLTGLVSGFLLLAPSTAHASILQKNQNNLGLVGYWSFNDGVGATSTDFSGSGNTGTLTNGPTWTTSGKTGGALNFDGTNDEVIIADSNSLDLTTLTIAAWIKTSASGQQIIFNHADSGSPWAGYGLATGLSVGSKLSFYSSGDGIWRGNGTVIADGNWHHVVGTYSATDTTMKLYVDGVNTETFTSIAAPGTTTNTANVSAAAGANPFNGSIDEVRIYNRALGATEVAYLYNNSKILRAKNNTNLGLVGYWPFSEGAGTTTADATGQGNTGTLGASTAAPTWTAGKFGKGLSFDGTNDYVDITSSGLTPIVGRTYTFWFYPTKSNESTILGGGVNLDFGNMVRVQTSKIGLYNAGTMFVYLNGTSTTATVDSGLTVNLNQWNFLAIRQTVTQTWNNLYIGRSDSLDGDRNFGGMIDDVRIYNRALTAQEMNQLYNQTATAVRTVSNKSTAGAPGTANLVGWWTFDGNKLNGTTITDSSGRGNNGTLAGSPVPTIGKIGQGLNFDGTDDMVSLAQTSGLPLLVNTTNAYSVSFWAKGDGTATGTVAPVFSEQGNNGGITIGAYNSLTVRVTVTNDAGTTLLNVLSTANGFDNKWHHITWVDDAGAGKLYIDGVQDSSNFAYTRSGTFTNTYQEKIGTYNSNPNAVFPFQGIIDDVRAYNKALSAAEVLSLYNSTK